MDEITLKIIEKSKELEETLIKIRRQIHSNPELGYETTMTSNLVKENLDKLDIPYFTIKDTGVVADIKGKGDKTLLLRADMDALPMCEENDLSFKSTEKVAHTCGHDMHTTMLLGAAMILKEYENELKGNIRLMFQPDEEGGTGAKVMYENGILDDIKIDGAMALHVDAKNPLGKIEYGYGKTFASNDNIVITVCGKGGHGARAYETVDPIFVGTKVIDTLYSIITREVDPFENTLFSVTSIETENTFNIIPDTIKIRASVRTYNEETRAFILERFEKAVKKVCEAYRGEAIFEIVKSLPSLVTSKEFTDEILSVSKNLNDFINIGGTVIKRGSEDFSYITNEIPNCGYFFIGAGKNKEEGSKYGQHNTKVVFNEDVLKKGSALLANAAIGWLKL